MRRFIAFSMFLSVMLISYAGYSFAQSSNDFVLPPTRQNLNKPFQDIRVIGNTNTLTRKSRVFLARQISGGSKPVFYREWFAPVYTSGTGKAFKAELGDKEYLPMFEVKKYQFVNSSTEFELPKTEMFQVGIEEYDESTYEWALVELRTYLVN